MSRSSYRRRNALIISCFVALFLLNGMPGFHALTAQAASTISGTVFRDYDANGQRNGVEPQIAGITVTAYDASNAVAGTATTVRCSAAGAGVDASGTAVSAAAAAGCTGSDAGANYSLSATGTGPYRIEFTGWPGYLQPSSVGSDAATTVQFVAGGATDVNLAMNNPAQFCERNPNIATSCYVFGDQVNGPNAANTAVLDFPYESGTSAAPGGIYSSPQPGGALLGAHTEDAQAHQIGAVWGMAYQRSSQNLFLGSFMKRHVGFGPTNDPGTIYRIDRTGALPNAVTYVTLPAGPNQHTPTNTTPGQPNYFDDLGAFDSVGRTGLGDVELSDDEQTLYAVNMYDSKLYLIDVSGPLSTTPTSTTVALPNTLPGAAVGCAVADVRPGALKVYDGVLYAGLTCTGPAVSDLRAYVYSYSGGSFSAAPVAEIALNYPRGCASTDGTTCASAAWQPWATNPSQLKTDAPYGQVYLPQPWLLDIEFDEYGFMTMNLSDRVGHQTGNKNGGAASGPVEGVAAGDMLRLAPGAGTWTLENNASVGVGLPGGATSAGAGTNQGPGGGEFYYQDRYAGTHTEVYLAGAAQVYGRGEIATAAFDPAMDGEYRAGGVVMSSHATGRRTRSIQVFGQDAVGTFGKAAGIGDIEALCTSAPIEVGNRVWNDVNDNGIQDAGETGIPGVTVKLYDSTGTLVPGATTTTDLNGNYLFSSAASGTGAAIYGLNIQPNTSYSIRIDNAADYTGPLAGLQLTTANNDPSANGDSRDSDATAFAATDVRIALTTGAAGANNHTYDIGFTPPLYSLGNRVWYDTDNSGTINGSEVGVDGVTVQLYAADGSGNPTGAVLATDLTDNGGSYLFTGLSAGDYVVVIPASNFGSGAVLEHYLSSGTTTAGETAAPDPDNDIDNDDNGTLQNGGAFNGAVLSKAVTLGGAEPTGEPPTPGRPDSTPDAQANYTVDFGFYTMSVGNFVWNDANNNGIFDGAETGLNGVAVRLYTSGGTLVGSTTTAGGGLYSFDGLADGDYYVQIDLPTNYVSSTGTNGSLTGPYEPAPDPDNDVDNDDNGSTSGGVTQSATFTLTPGAEPTITNPIGKTANSTVDFGLFQPLALGNRVWNDANNNGVLDGAETGIGGVTVNLYAANGTTLIGTTTTNGNGYYLFTGLAAGDYIVEVVPPAGYRSSTGTNGSLTGPYEGVLTPDPDTNPADNDDNGSTSGAVIRSALVTLAAGTEPIGEQNGGGDTTLDANSNLTVDFGLFRPFSLGNRVWEDTDNSGTINGSETIGSIGTLTVRLYASDGTTLIASTTTDASGYYRFDNLAAGDYIVDVNIPAGYASSTGAGQEANPNNDGDSNDNGVTAAGASIRSGLVTLGSDATPAEPTGETDLGPGGQGAADNRANMTVDFGFYRLLSLGNLIWNDSNNDGLFNGTETGVNGVTVELYTDTNGNGSFDAGTDTLVTSQVTVNGAYLFTGLQPGEYIVVLPASNFATGGPLENYSSSTGAGSGYEPAPDPDNDVNNDDNGSVIGTLGGTGIIASKAVTLAPGTEPTNDGDTDANSNLSVDFGVFNLASIGDFVWNDVNFNGIQDAGEPGVNGVTVTLYQPGPDGIAGTADDVQIGTTTTSNGGAYSFTGLQPGDYFVTFSGLPAGYVFSPQNQGGDDTVDSDADTTTGRTIITTLTPGENDPTWDAGIYQLAGLGDFVWEDLDHDGVQDPSEPGIGGVTVNLLDGSGNVIATTTTDGSGSYFFGGLTPGVPYQVEFVPPAGYLLTLANQGGDDTVDSDADVATGRTPQVTLTAGESNPTLDAGLYRPASLGDYVWYDTNVNGVQDGGETGVLNVTVNLYSPGYGPDGIPNNADDAAVVATKTTDNTGFYQFTGLTPGVPYQVEVVKPAGYAFSPQDQGGDDTVDSDVDRTSGRTPTVTLQSNENNPTLDAGIYQLASIGDFVWFDANGNGVQDTGEAGVPNVSVELFTGAGVSVGTTTTGANGDYLFNNLQPGDYYVVFSLPSGYVFSPQNQGGDNAKDSDANTTTGRTITTTLTPSENDLTWDAGIYQLVSLGNLVWNDINNNGVVDGGEAGFGGVTVNLYAADGTTLINSTATLADGTYLFQNLVPGDYIVALPASNFAAGGPLEGYRSSTGTNGNATGPNEPAPDPDNDVDSDDNGSAANGAVASAAITLLSGGEPTAEDGDANSNLTVDFGLFLPASLGSVVWQDDNRDGQRDPGEPGVGSVTVTLYDQNGNVVATTTTDQNGNFLFDNLVPGTYTVGFSNLPPNYVFTTPNQGSDTTDSDVNPNTGLTDSVTLVPGQNDLTVYAGIVPSSPTAIQLLNFAATRTDGGVAVHWQTGAEINTLGFHLFRSTTGQRADAYRITQQLIAANGRGGDGASYTWLDTTAQPTVNYTYWLEETEANGSTHEYGPVRVGGASVQMKNRVFIPLITR